MEYEFDPGKSAANEIKHGIDFVEAQALWMDERLVEASARTEDEPRFLVFGGSAAGSGRPFVSAGANEPGSFRFAGPGKRRSVFMKARQFDEKFDAGEDVSDEVDWAKARRPNLTVKRVNVDFPMW